MKNINHTRSSISDDIGSAGMPRSEERFSRNAETDLVCRLLLEKKNIGQTRTSDRVPRGNEGARACLRSMRVTVGACVDWRILHHLHPHDARTVRQLGREE